MRAHFYLIAMAIGGLYAVMTPLATETKGAAIKSMESATLDAARELGRLENQALIFPADRQLYAEAGKTAWRYVEQHYQPHTGLVDATMGYPYTTVWDIASSLAALYAGHELKLLNTPEYDIRMRQALQTLRTIDMFDAAAFNKVYSTRTGAMIGRNQRPSKLGYGWSATDLGRLLVWLKIVAVNQPQYRDDAAAVVNRLAMSRLVKDGYLRGEDLDAAGAPRLYQEGQIGYEQYAAQGFALWGFAPQKAMSLRENGVPITVMGKTLLADLRGRDRVTSDPFILMGLELGWNREMAQLAGQLLAVQEERYRKTGRVTLVAEDAVSVAPHFFFYYSAYTNNKDFGIDVQSPVGVENPRWVSAKAAFAWHALLPSAYTELALRTVMPARSPNGWSSGVYEASGKSTETLNINTAAVILTAALVHATGEPLLIPER
jgi:hypothetical protein